MPEVSYDEAVRALERFRSDRCRLRLSGMGFGWSLAIPGYISEFAEGAVGFALPGGEEAFALRLDMEDVVFWVGDAGSVPAEIRRGIAGLDAAPSFVGVVLPYRVVPDALAGPVCAHELRPRERVFFCEIPREEPAPVQSAATHQ